MATSIAVVGAGSWGRKIIQTASALECLDLKYVVSSNPETADYIPAGCQQLPDVSHLLEKPELQGVVLATPPELHVPQARIFLEAGLPCMIEKPLSMNSKEALGLIQIAKNNRSFVLVDHIYLYHPAYEALKSEIMKDTSPVIDICSEGGANGPYGRATPVLWDWLPHDLSIVLDLMGADPVGHSIASQPSENQDGSGIIYDVKLEFGSGATASIVTGNGFLRRRRKLTVETQDHYWRFADENSPQASCDSLPLAFCDEKPLARILTRFASGIEEKSQTCRDLELGHRVVLVIEKLAEQCGNIATH